MLERSDVRTAMYGGDDVTDLDAFDALEALVDAGELEQKVCVGVRSSEGPAAIVDRADVVVDGVSGFTDVLAALLR
jgi:trehalose 6-phosphate phosphatase